MNIKLAEKILDEAVRAGVRDFCLCPGARNSPFVAVLEKAKGLQLHSFFEERSAAFYALGRVKKTGFPAAVITTSGTAVAELLPATIEANYSGLPLLLITADRPRRYRGKGAPQSIEQIGLFSHYVQTTLDIEELTDRCTLDEWNLKQPIHMNICFDEPLIPSSEMVAEKSYQFIDAHAFFQRKNKLQFFSQKKRTVKNPLIIVGELDLQKTDHVIRFLKSTGAPIYAEAISNLRGAPQLSSQLLFGGEKVVSELFESGTCESVLRIGGVPTLRFWRDLEEKWKTIQVVSVSDVDYTGLARQADHLVGYHHLEYVQIETNYSKSRIFDLDQKRTTQIQTLIKEYPACEVSLFDRLTERVQNSSLYIGNSLPIRELDLVIGNKHFMEVFANRGANGIDGQISTYFGTTEENEESWCIVGDLTTLYDLSAPWISDKLSERKMRIVVINNQGGQIFSNMFPQKGFINSHQIEFSTWAKMWGWDYVKAYKIDEIPNQLPQKIVIEIVPDHEQSKKFWKEYRLL